MSDVPPPPESFSAMFARMTGSSRTTRLVLPESQHREAFDKRNVRGRAGLTYDPVTRPDRYKHVRWLKSSEAIVAYATQLTWDLYRLPLRCTDVEQGSLGNCWLLAVIAALAESRPELMLQIVSQATEYDKDNVPYTVYSVRLYWMGVPVVVTIKDEFPCQGDKQFMYASSPSKQLYAILIEKAVALLYSCYEALKDGVAREGFSTLTRFPCRQISLTSGDPDDRWNDLMDCQRQRFPMVTATNTVDKKEEPSFTKVGLTSTHCFALLNLTTVDGIRMAKLYNPHGKPSGTDKWWDEPENELKNEQWEAAVDKVAKPEELAKGIFFVPYEKLCHYFIFVDVCQVKDWLVTRFKGQLPTSGIDHHHMSIFQFEVLNDSTRVELVFHQESKRTRRNYFTPGIPIGVAIYELKNNRCCLTGDFISFSGYNASLYVRCAVDLDKGTYLAVPFALNHWPTPPAVLATIITDTNRGYTAPHNQPLHEVVTSFHHSKPITVTCHACTTDILGDALYSLVKGLVDPEELADNVECYMLGNRWFGLVVVIVNNNDDDSISITFDASESVNVVSTRGVLKTTDTVKPRTWQVIAVLSEGAPKKRFEVKHKPIECTTLNGSVDEAHNPALTDIESIHRPRALPPTQ